MARVTVEDCLAHTTNKFELAAIASKRARQLAGGAHSKLEWEGDKPSVLALREIAEGMISRNILLESDLQVDSVGSENAEAADAEDGGEQPPAE